MIGSRKDRLVRVALAASVAVTIAAGLGISRAHAEDDETFEEGVIRQFMRGIGLKDSSDTGITYQERAPLVVPPSRDLPPPNTSAAAIKDPSWPVDPEVRRRAEKRKRAGPQQDGATAVFEQSKPLSPSELDKGRIANDGKPIASASATDPSVPLKPSALGYKKGFFDSLWSKVAPAKDEVGTFTGEPARTTLTEPPAGYQTPAPNQPYGTVARKDDDNKDVKRYLAEPSTYDGRGH